MESPSRIDDEDYEPLEEEDDDEDYMPGKKKKPSKKKKQIPKAPQKSSSHIQFVAEIPIEFEVGPTSSKNDTEKKPERQPPTSTLDEKSNEQNVNNPEPVRKKPRKMITPQRSRIDFISKKLVENAQAAIRVSSATEKDPLTSTDSANNIPKILMNNAVNRFPCGFCDTVFTDVSFLERHHKRCKSKRTAESVSLVNRKPTTTTSPEKFTPVYSPSAPERFMYACDQCPFYTKNAEHLKYHRPIHNTEQYFSCNQCKFSCRNKEQLEIHKKLHPERKGVEKAADGDNEVNRELKSKEDAAVKQVEESKEEIEEPNVIRMPLPPRKFDDKTEGGIMYTCDQCTYSTSRQNYLIMHKKIHVRDMPYQCLDCGYKCSRLAYFRKHRATHGVTDEILISCDRCSFTTSSQNVLDAHKQCHKV